MVPNDLTWDEVKLHDLCEQETREAIWRIKIYGADIEDKLFWTSTSNGVFSVKSCYNILSNNGETCDSIWKEIWTAKIHERLKMFLWRLAADVLSTKDLLFERIGKGDPSCSFCGSSKETPSHLFLECPVARAVAFGSKWGLRLDSIPLRNMQEMVRWCVNPPHQMYSNLGGKDFTFLLFTTFLSIIWELRNDKVFQDKSSIALATARWESLFEECKFVALVQDYLPQPSRKAFWHPPQNGRICINTDAACTSDKAAIALIAMDYKGIIKHLAAEPIPPVRTDIAELQAIEWAASFVEESDWKDVDWLCDARSVVDQLNNSSDPCKLESWSLVKKPRDKMKANNWTISWTPRQANKSADLAAKAALKDNFSFLCSNANFCNWPATVLAQILSEELAAICYLG
ncbi:uncharacterized protein LOC107414189 [Ziziphus jujuba]|uniref:Uncharacterized protein LOC107414189 n=1 Tax=Ziziphus jujuba TaxID=326968 RepID=A0ABM3I850_ZIZJJ|nr:uncharacterized protein LOC107414189 [Ziziphus jujuba]